MRAANGVTGGGKGNSAVQDDHRTDAADLGALRREWARQPAVVSYCQPQQLATHLRSDEEPGQSAAFALQLLTLRNCRLGLLSSQQVEEVKPFSRTGVACS